MSHPAFFDEVKTLTLRDPLADVLGAASDGLMTYGYLDAVKLAGHSCPTVAGAWLMTLKALEKLYPDSTPERGGIKVEFGAGQNEGVTGVIAAVASLLTGAAGDGGFKGLGGKFSRRNLLHFGIGSGIEVKFTRMDTGAAMTVSYHPEVVPPPPELPALMQKLLSGEASADERAQFGTLWQMRVKRILIDHFDDQELVVIDQD
jgi:formylmethanofuran dehydrogenase subunit E